jgi:hypothetical protein
MGVNINYQLEEIKYLPIFYIIVLTYEDILDIMFLGVKNWKVIF